MSWSISVKVVGSLPTPSPFRTDNADPNSATATSLAPRDFDIKISPDEPLSALHSKIEQISGLTAQQQRLIYRGRLISGPSSDESQTSKSLLTPIRSIDGLEDGHTIHLVPRPPVAAASPPVSGGEDGANHTAGNEGGPRIIAGDGAGLIGALLNLGQDMESDNERGNGNGSGSTSGDPLETLISFPRTVRSTRRRSRPNSHRRLATDPRYPDPCPLEPIRQGMMTLHTMIQSQQEDLSSTTSSRRTCVDGTATTSSLDVNRKWFIGQWLDVRDTVNQWLEATIVDVVTPDDLLVRAPKEENNQTSNAHVDRNRAAVSVDPIVSANDYEGRVRLLLEPAEDENDRTLADLNHDEDLVGLVERQSNDHVQLILVHYNGWPRRWDEWIRSDSERIRPFRTRSRHVSNANHFCPTTESTFESAPNTHIKSADDEIDREAVLPELYRILSDVQKVFKSAIYGGKRGKILEDGVGVRPLSPKEQRELTEAMQNVDPTIVNQVMAIVQGDHQGGKDMDPADVDITALDSETQWKLKELFELPGVYHLGDTHLPWNTNQHAKKKKQKIDDVDSAQNDRNEENDTPDSSVSPNFDNRSLEALGPLMDRLGRVLIDTAPHVAKLAESLAVEETENQSVRRQDENTDVTEESQPPPLRPSWTNSHAAPLFDTESDESPHQGPSSVNPDLVDYVHSFINNRNDGSSSRRSARRNREDGGLGSSILSAYLASLIAGVDGASGTRNGPRVVRIGSNDNDDTPSPGLDIHIHAIVSGPGGPFMPDFLSGLGSGTAPTSNNERNVNVESIHQQMEEENTETFRNLYSEESPAQNASSEFLPNEDVEIEDESETNSVAGSHISEAAMPLLESNSNVAGNDETELDDDEEHLEISRISNTGDISCHGDDELQTSHVSEAVTNDGPIVEIDDNQTSSEEPNENDHNEMTFVSKENVDNDQGDDSSYDTHKRLEEYPKPEGTSDEVESGKSSSVPKVDNKPFVDIHPVDSEMVGHCDNGTARDCMTNDEYSCDVSSQDDEIVHTAYECMDENYIAEGVSDNIDGEISSLKANSDIKSFVISSKDSGNMEVCLDEMGSYENSTGTEKDLKQEATNPCDDIPCKDVKSSLSASADATSMLHDGNTSEEQNVRDDREHPSSNSVAKTPKSFFSRLMRRKQ